MHLYPGGVTVICPKPCFSYRSEVDQFVFKKSTKVADLLLMDLMLRRQPVKSLEFVSGLRLASLKSRLQ